MRVYLSFVQQDRKWADDLTNRLGKLGFDVWNFGRDVLPGDNLGNKIGRALEEADAMIVLVTPASMKSEWVSREIEYAL